MGDKKVPNSIQNVRRSDWRYADRWISENPRRVFLIAVGMAFCSLLLHFFFGAGGDGRPDLVFKAEMASFVSALGSFYLFYRAYRGYRNIR
ncbi:MAG: hypothetical protein KDI13_06410 [Alphaproteobacteria bacterium]|nr:hypothetical protein [Alphaproteobacteria bacterium]